MLFFTFSWARGGVGSHGAVAIAAIVASASLGTWAGLGVPGQLPFPNPGDISLNRVAVVARAVLSRAGGVPSMQVRSSHDNGLIFSEPLQVKSRGVKTRSTPGQD